MTVKIDDDSIDALPLVLDIKFVSPPPQFYRKHYKIDPVTCSLKDETWELPLPSIVDADT